MKIPDLGTRVIFVALTVTSFAWEAERVDPKYRDTFPPGARIS